MKNTIPFPVVFYVNYERDISFQNNVSTNNIYLTGFVELFN